MKRSTKHNKIFLLTAVLILAGPFATKAATPEFKVEKLLQQVEFPTGYTFQGTEVGGLSAISYDPAKKVYYLLSDDRGDHGRPRFYTATIDPEKKGRAAISFLTVTFLSHSGGVAIRPGSIDPEGIAFAGHKRLFISSEGVAELGIPPFVGEYDLGGQLRKLLPLPAPFYPRPDDNMGVRDNLAFESLALCPDGKTLYTATENALAQDGPEADVDTSSPARILAYDLTSGRPTAQYLYRTEPVAVAPKPSFLYHMNGLAELLCLGDKKLLALERSFTLNRGITSRLFMVDLGHADDIRALAVLDGAKNRRSATKTLLLNLAATGVTPDNIEGMALGPKLSSDRRLLVMVSDNNFRHQQRTQFLFFSVRLDKR